MMASEEKRFISAAEHSTVELGGASRKIQPTEIKLSWAEYKALIKERDKARDVARYAWRYLRRGWPEGGVAAAKEHPWLTEVPGLWFCDCGAENPSHYRRCGRCLKMLDP